MASFPNLFSLFGGPRRAVDSALQASRGGQMRTMANNIAAGTARGGLNPLAVARVRNQATTDERNAMAQREAQMRAQADLQQQQDISQLIGGGIGLVGTALGGMVGGPVGGAAGGALGGLASQGVSGLMGGGASQAPQAARSPLQASTMPPVPMGAGRALGNPAVGMGRALGAPNAASQAITAPRPAAQAQAPRAGAPGVFGPQIDPEDFAQRLFGAFGAIPGLGGR